MSEYPFHLYFVLASRDFDQAASSVKELFDSNVLVPRNGGFSDYTFVEFEPEFDRIQLSVSEVMERLRTTHGRVETEQFGWPTNLYFEESGAIGNRPELRLTSGNVPFDFAEKTEIELKENAMAVADTVETIYDVVEPLFVWGYTPAPNCKRDPALETSVKRLEDGYVDALSWLTVFPPAAVRRYGREKLLSAPAWGIREFDDGAIMLITGPTPTDFGAVEETAHEIAAHLDMDLDPDALPGDFDER